MLDGIALSERLLQLPTLPPLHRFPGTEAAWNGLVDVTDADLLADAMVHLATTHACTNQVGDRQAHMSGAMRTAWFDAVVPQPGRPAVLHTPVPTMRSVHRTCAAKLSTDLH